MNHDEKQFTIFGIIVIVGVLIITGVRVYREQIDPKVLYEKEMLNDPYAMIHWESDEDRTPEIWTSSGGMVCSFNQDYSQMTIPRANVKHLKRMEGNYVIEFAGDLLVEDDGPHFLIEDGYSISYMMHLYSVNRGIFKRGFMYSKETTPNKSDRR